MNYELFVIFEFTDSQIFKFTDSQNMFTGIIEAKGKIAAIEQEGKNVHFTIETPLSAELKIDQSVAHNGVCLTVVACDAEKYTVTAIHETMQITSLQHWKVGDLVNLERAMQANARLDGHFVQGHVDQTAVCTKISEADGSWYFHFKFEPSEIAILVPKGSICANGVSLTVVEAKKDAFSVAIIPYTYEHTNFNTFEIGTVINLEFDVIGKYITKMFRLYAPHLK